MAQTQHRVAIRTSLDGAVEVKQGLREIGEAGNREMGKLAQGAQVAQRAFSLLGPVLAGISVGALAAFTKNALDAVDAIGEVAEQIGVSTGALQAFRLAAVQTGLSTEELERGVAALTRKIADAVQGDKAAVDAFNQLGIAFRNADGSGRATEAVMGDLADKVAEMDSATDKAAATTALISDRFGQKFIPMLSQGRDGLVAMTAEMLRMGTIATPEMIAKAGEASDKIAALTSSFRAFANNMTVSVAPAIASVVDGLNRLIFGMSMAERRVSLETQIGAAERQIERLRQGPAAGEAPGVGVGGRLRAAQNAQGAGQSSSVGDRLAAGRGNTGESVEVMIERERQRIVDLRGQLAQLNQQEQGLREQANRILSPTEPLGPELPPGFRFPGQGGGGGAAPRAPGRDPFAETLREQQSLLRANETAYERYQRQLEELAALQDRLNEAEAQGVEINGVRVRALSTEELSRATERFANELERAEKQTERTDRMGVQMGMTFASDFEDAILKGSRFSDILKAIEQDIARIILRQTITAPIGNAIGGAIGQGMSSITGSFSSMFGGGQGVQIYSSPSSVGPFLPSANGNAFIGGHLIPFANGGIVSSPTMFPMARGMGLMGEAGPEAIMPLQRGADGKLGVRAGGGGQGGVVINQTITIDARGADPSVDQKIRAAITIATKQAQAEMLDAVSRGGNAAKIMGRR
ncbi:MAG: hypothetical protein ING00_17590 [Roseomonas sp.]|nr:hypothetical protein [Roseomonas sp.]